MTQHFLLSAQARTLSLAEVFALSEQGAFEVFRELRWGAGEETGCPVCGSYARHPFIRCRRQWRCSDCGHTFSVTSGTIFAFHKLPLKTYLCALAISTNAAKGLSALQLSRDLDVQYKTAFVLAHKIRSALMERRNTAPLSGDVELDGVYLNGHVRPRNKKEDRVDRRLKEHQNPHKRCVVVLRERVTAETAAGDDGQPQEGAARTLTTVMVEENAGDMIRVAANRIDPAATVYADEHPACDPLHGLFKTQRVNHEQQYSLGNGISTNLAESFFSRFRRMQIGQNHHFGILYLENYANEAAYREDTRRWSNGRIFRDITGKCMATPTSRDWCGYWQGNKRAGERLLN